MQPRKGKRRVTQLIPSHSHWAATAKRTVACRVYISTRVIIRRSYLSYIGCYRLSGGTTKRSSFDSTENQRIIKTKEIDNNALYHHSKSLSNEKRKNYRIPSSLATVAILIELAN